MSLYFCRRERWRIELLIGKNFENWNLNFGCAGNITTCTSYRNFPEFSNPWTWKTIYFYGTVHDLHVFIHHHKWQYMSSMYFIIACQRGGITKYILVMKNFAYMQKRRHWNVSVLIINAVILKQNGAVSSLKLRCSSLMNRFLRTMKIDAKLLLWTVMIISSVIYQVLCSNTEKHWKKCSLWIMLVRADNQKVLN